MMFENLRSITAAALLACVAGGAWGDAPKADKFLDFTQPKFAEDVDKADDYVDPARLNNRRCKDRPYRPGWLMVHPRGLDWRSDIGREYKASITVNKVLEVGKCTCDLAYPDWNKLRPEIEALWAKFGNLPTMSWSEEITDEFYDTKNEISRSYSSKLGRYSAMCASLE